MRVLAVSAALALVAGLAAAPAHAGDYSVSIEFQRDGRHVTHGTVAVHRGSHHRARRHHHLRARPIVRHVTRRVGRHVPRRVVHVHHRPARVWIAGHYETRTRRVWVPGYYEQKVEPALIEKRFDERTCAWEEVVVRPERIVKIWVAGRHEDRDERVWVAGHWKVRRHHHHH